MTSNDVPQSRDCLLRQVVEILEGITRSGPRTVSSEWFTLELSTPHVRTLFLLHQEGILRMSDIASTLGVSMSRATGLADKLVEKDLLNRWPDREDRRLVLCALTDQGTDLCQRLLAARRSRWEERLAPLSSAELRKVYKAMELVRNAIGRANPDAEIETGPTYTLPR